MATFKDGINGPFRGKIGGVVGYQWKGIWVMRSLPRPMRKKKWSERQLANHARMRIMQNFLGANQEFVRRGFGLVPEIERMSAYNTAMSYNKKNAIKGECNREITMHSFWQLRLHRFWQQECTALQR